VAIIAPSPQPLRRSFSSLRAAHGAESPQARPVTSVTVLRLPPWHHPRINMEGDMRITAIIIVLLAGFGLITLNKVLPTVETLTSPEMISAAP
jgi:hypothetical protein